MLRRCGARLLKQYRKYVEVVGLCDISPRHVWVGRELIGVDGPLYSAEQFEQMIRETGRDPVIVTTTDCFHPDHVLKTIELGCDVLSEKPLATEAEQCQKLPEAEVCSGKRIRPV